MSADELTMSRHTTDAVSGLGVLDLARVKANKRERKASAKGGSGPTAAAL